MALVPEEIHFAEKCLRSPWSRELPVWSTAARAGRSRTTAPSALQSRGAQTQCLPLRTVLCRPFTKLELFFKMNSGEIPAPERNQVRLK